jgi:hypothetical protein
MQLNGTCESGSKDDAAVPTSAQQAERNRADQRMLPDVFSASADHFHKYFLQVSASSLGRDRKMSCRAVSSEKLSGLKFAIPSISQAVVLWTDSASNVRLDEGVGPALCFLLRLTGKDCSAPHVGQFPLLGTL